MILAGDSSKDGKMGEEELGRSFHFGKRQFVFELPADFVKN